MSRRPLGARQLALRTLRAVEQRRGFSNRILGEQLERHPELSRADRGLATALVYGTLRQRARLDHYIDAVARRPSGLKGELRWALRLGVFELTTLDRPVAVVGAETVRLIQPMDRGGRLKGLVTAVVANVERRRPALDAELAAAPPIERLTVGCSLPRWLARRWLDELGPEVALARAARLDGPPSVDLRVDLTRISREAAARRLLDEHPGVAVELPEYAPQALRARGGGDLFYGPLHEEGLVSVQSLGSQAAAIVLAPRPGERVWDACAGMGVKTLQLAELMARQGFIYATDPSAGRLEALREAGERGGLGPDEAPELAIQVEARSLGAGAPAEAPAAPPDEQPFDAILVDAPCTGLGNLARHPELRWTTQEGDIAACAALQAKILREAAAALAPGGRLVYAVCSLEPEEGEALVQALAPELGLQVVRSERWTPETHDTDGHYLALCRRDG